MGGRGSSFAPVSIHLSWGEKTGKVSPLITAGLMELRGNEADPESTLRRIDDVRFNNLDHEQLFVVDRDGFVLCGYDGGEHSVAFPPEKAVEWKDCIVTHRHPSSFGGTFSPADISCIATFGWSELEASANEGRYKIKRTSKNADGAGLVRRLQSGLPKIQQQMREIAISMSTGKKYMSHDQFIYENRKKQLAVLDAWYAENLPKYGFTYKFTSREEYKK